MDSLGTSPIQTNERKHRILVVEDEAMICMLLEDMVLDCGGELVGPVARFDDALALAHRAEFGVAVLDLNLNGTLSYPIAEVLSSTRPCATSAPAIRALPPPSGARP
jgi:DNA-binding response OmpR family regulator